MERRIIKLKEVMHLTSLSRAQVYRYVRDEKYARYGFPKPHHLGHRNGWWLHEVVEWLQTRPRW